jgi:hypothetical protein
MQKVWNTLAIADDDRRWEHVGGRPSKRRIRQRKIHFRGSTNPPLPTELAQQPLTKIN